MADPRQKLLLTNIHLKGYKSIIDVDVNIKKGLNILIGKNGSGKSNFLEGVYAALAYRLRDKVAFKYAMFKYHSTSAEIIKTEYEKLAKNFNTNNDEDFFEDQLKIAQRLLIDGKIIYDTQTAEQQQYILPNGRQIKLTGSVGNVLHRLNYHYTHLCLITFNIPNDLKFIDSSNELDIEVTDEPFDTWPEIKTLNFVKDIFYGIENEYSGEFERIKTITPDTFAGHLVIKNDIVDNLKRFTPITDIAFNKRINVFHGDQNVIIDGIKLDFKVNGTWLPWSQLSDGTKRLFYLVTEITNHQGGLVLVEEPELGVHPHQLSLLMDFLKEQSEDKQIIISTHSPLVLDHLNEDELGHVMIAKYDIKKGTQIKPLSTAQIKKAKAYIQDVGFFSDYWVHSDLE